MKILRDIWGFANIAYQEPTNAGQLVSLSKNRYNIQEPDKFIHKIDNTDYAFIAEYPNRIIMTFRGTDNIKGWLSDFEIYPLQEAKTIHQGFYDGWIVFKEMIDKYIKSYDEKPIYTTGHSRGAALAVLCARHLAKNRGINGLSCIVYGCPRIGNKTFRDEYNKLPIDTTRVENGYDLVTGAPPSKMGFRHVGKDCWLEKPRWHRWFLKMYDHLTKNYEKSLNTGKHRKH